MVTYTAPLAYYFLRESSTSFSHFKVSKMVWTHGIENRIVVILNQASVCYMVTIPLYQLSMTDGSNLSDALTGNVYRAYNGQVTVDV